MKLKEYIAVTTECAFYFHCPSTFMHAETKGDVIKKYL